MNCSKAFMAAAIATVFGCAVSTYAQVDLDLDKLLNEIKTPEEPAATNQPAPAVETPSPVGTTPVETPSETGPSATGNAATGTPATTEAVPPTEEEAQLTAQQEIVRRQALDIEGKRALQDGLAALREENYSKAGELFAQAASKIQDRPDSAEALKKARWGRAEVAYRLARAAYDREEFTEALKQAEIATKDPEHESAARSLARRVRQREVQIASATPAVTPPAERPDYVAKETQIEQLFNEGRQFFAVEDYDKAEQNFEKILLIDPYHRDAMRFLKKIDERRLSFANLHREATLASMVEEVRRKWNPPIRQVVAAPSQAQGRSPVATGSSARLLQGKMNSIVIPAIEFRQANIVDVINFLRDASEAADPDRVGVNIILKLENFGGGSASAAPAPAPTPDTRAPAFDDWNIPGGDTTTTPGGVLPEPTAATPSNIPAITLNLRRVTLLDAIKYVTEVAGLKYRIEENAVIITPANVVTGTIITRFYPVQPSILDIVVSKADTTDVSEGRTGAGGGEFIGMGGSNVTMKRDDVRDFFVKAGVPFPPGTSITYNSSISQLIVANTAENLELFEKVLAQLNVIPNQVEIEARFVQISQTDLTELGFQWLLTDNWEVANKKGPGPITSKERIQVNANSAAGGFTSGLRYFGSTGSGFGPVSQGTAGSVMTISSILTNPELSVILHALQQRGGADLLSAPRVTTRSGVNAQIQVVREIIYPTEYESQDVGDFGVFGGQNLSVQDLNSIVGSYRPPLPSAFETRETGVILNVTPTVGPDGYTIDLTLVPEVAELVDWIDYGPPNVYPILQPIFASRSVTTSIVLWDGQTVVMGGMIRETAATYNDRIPLLGDIPLLGRLFRSNGENSTKENLVIFVTARLVDPAGNPIHQKSTYGGATQTATATETKQP